MTTGGFRRRQEFQVDPSDPFKNDKLGVAQLVPPLTRLIEKSPGPYVIAVNADYGIGKTSFLRMWRAYLEGEGARTLYFDAWQHDFIEPPLTALIGEIEEQIKTVSGVKAAKASLHKTGIAAIQALAPIGAKELTRLLITIAAGAIGGSIGADAARGVIGKLAKIEVGDAIGKVVSEAARDRIKQYEQEKRTLGAFRESLRGFAAAVARPQGGKGKEAAASRVLPLIFIIDELDRCRPNYAIELLETLKHLFAVEGVVFILGVNCRVLANSFGAVYGHDFKGDEYLRRFVDLQYTLPEPPLKEFCAQLAEEFIVPMHLPLKNGRFYYSWAGCNEHVPYRDIFAITIRTFARGLGRSLRDIEQVFSRAGAALATLPEGRHIEPAYFAYLLLAQEAAPEAYHTFAHGGSGSNLEAELTKMYPAHRLQGTAPLVLIIAECLNHQHQGQVEIGKRFNNLDRQIHETRSDSDSIPWALHAHDSKRFKDATGLVAMAQQFEGVVRR